MNTHDGHSKPSIGAIVALLAFLLAGACGGGCSSSAPGTRWSRHFDGAVWGGALEQQVARPDRLVPEAVLLAAIPAGFAYDTDIQEHEENRGVSPTTKNAANALQVVAAAIPVTIGAVDWAGGDGGRHLEVVAESLLGVVAVQQILGRTVGRERPNHKDDRSFPSGHTSWSFAATTLIVRDLHDPSDSSFHPVDVLLYAPAIFTGWERIASNRHWTSDVACGALLGVFLTNWIWDAHYRSDQETRPGIFMEDRPHGITLSPSLDLVEGGFVLGIKLGF
ncbi:MAG TPA: phosphatase PAP2 family protein [Planctomycetota bacterium]|nr:phosphatase PAP2 family protein [Planctomycetota bacterium]